MSEISRREARRAAVFLLYQWDVTTQPLGSLHEGELDARPGAIVLPRWVIDAVAPAPRGAHPSYAHGYYDRDNEFYRRWDEISRDRDTFRAWMDEHVLSAVAA